MIDSPGIYSILYLSDAPAGAIAEAFGRLAEWNDAILEGSPSLPGSARAIARFRLPDDALVCNLDDPAVLQELGLRPSDVVSRDYARTPGMGSEHLRTGTVVRCEMVVLLRFAMGQLWAMEPQPAQT
jgi:hypothetical protein